MPLINLAIAYAMSFVGTPYKWGGSNPIEGMDCSGFVQEVLASVGLDPSGDQTAQSLYNHFKITGTSEIVPGAIVFFGKDTKTITHVAFCIDALHCIEAGGGGSRTVTRDDASKHNAFIRVRPIIHRKDIQAVILPKY